MNPINRQLIEIYIVQLHEIDFTESVVGTITDNNSIFN